MPAKKAKRKAAKLRTRTTEKQRLQGRIRYLEAQVNRAYGIVTSGGPYNGIGCAMGTGGVGIVPSKTPPKIIRIAATSALEHTIHYPGITKPPKPPREPTRIEKWLSQYLITPMDIIRLFKP